MGRILAIDDDEKILNNITEILTEGGHEVTAVDGINALPIITGMFDFDLVISDLVMPEVDGHEILRKIREKNTEIPVILMTAFGTIENAVDSIKKGATDYLPKPFRMKELEVTVNRVLEEAKFKERLLNLGNKEDVEKVFSGLSSPIRRDIIIALKDSPMSFSEIFKCCKVDDPTKLNFHLNKLKDGKIIIQKEQKKYTLTPLGEKAYDMICMVLQEDEIVE